MSSFVKTAAGKHRAGLVWFKPTDLRLRDHLPLTKAHSECQKVEHVFVFDPRHYQNTRRGHVKANFRRFKFQVQCVNDLCNSLTHTGRSLTILLGEPERVLTDYAKLLEVRGDDCRLYCFDEVCDEEIKVLQNVKSNLANECSTPLSLSWGGGTLFEASDLPFDVKSLEFFTGFRKSVERPHVWAKVKPPLPVPPAFMPPIGAAVSNTELKVLSGPISDPSSLWVSLRGWYGEREPEEPPVDADTTQSIDARAVLDFKGGESAAWGRIEHYIVQGAVKGRLCTYKETRNGMVGADYSSKFSPYLAAGTVTARSIYAEVKKFEARTGISNENTYWLIFELLWRDYMRFYAMKYGNRMFFLGGPQGEAGKRKYPWNNNEVMLNAWINGQTGYPLIDGMCAFLKLTADVAEHHGLFYRSFSLICYFYSQRI
jgi:deoxyribodipyrimidine photo-lyase